MKFLRKLLTEKPVRTPIPFGINENVRLVSIDNTPRFKDNARLERNTFLTFQQFNADGKVVASTEVFYFDLTPNQDYTAKSLAKQYGQLQCICDVLGANTIIDPTLIYDNNEAAYEAGLKDKAKCEEMQDLMWTQFHNGVKDLVGKESKLLRMKVVTSKDGLHLNLPSASLFLEPMDQESTSLSITPYELKCKRAANETPSITPDVKGGVPGERAKSKAALELL